VDPSAEPADLALRLARAAALKAAATNLKRLYVVDSFPIPLCDPSALRASAARPSEAPQRRRGLFRPVGERVVFRVSDPCSLSSAHRRSAHRNAASRQLVVLSNWDDRRAVQALALSTGVALFTEGGVPQKGAFSSATRGTAGRKPSTGRAARPRRFG
jgi:hypothetical protein